MPTIGEKEQIAVLQTQMISVKETLVRIEAKIDAQDKKYASKWVQQVVGGFVSLALIAVVTALLALVIIPATKKPDKSSSASQPTSQSSSSSPANGTGTPQSVEANAQAQSSSEKPKDSQTSTSNPVEGILNTLKGAN